MIGFVVAGLSTGALARPITPGKQDLGPLATLLLGLAGSVIGGVVADMLGTGGVRAGRPRLRRCCQRRHHRVTTHLVTGEDAVSDDRRPWSPPAPLGDGIDQAGR